MEGRRKENEERKIKGEERKLEKGNGIYRKKKKRG
jgi:hypothetical protein